MLFCLLETRWEQSLTPHERLALKQLLISSAEGLRKDIWCSRVGFLHIAMMCSMRACICLDR